MRGMVRTCAGLCKTHYRKIVRETLQGVITKRDWLKCPKCEVYIKFGRLKIYLCPCCHVTLKRDNRHVYVRRRAYHHTYYVNNKSRILEKQKIRRALKKLQAKPLELVEIIQR